MAIRKAVLNAGIDIEVNSGGELFKAYGSVFVRTRSSSMAPANQTKEIDRASARAFTRSTLIRSLKLSWSRNQ
jgi:hypothetical protein